MLCFIATNTSFMSTIFFIDNNKNTEHMHLD